MFGVKLILVLAVMGGVIAVIADKLGSKIGKKKVSVFGLRPRDTSTLLTVLTGVLVAAATIGVLSLASLSVRTALFGMETLRNEINSISVERAQVEQALEKRNLEIKQLDDRLSEIQKEKETMELELSTANERYEEVSNRLSSFQNQVATLQAARNALNGEIENLEKRAATLQEGLTIVRGGQVLYRTGEIIFSGVVDGTESSDEAKNRLAWVLDSANIAVFNRMGLENPNNIRAIWVPQEEEEATIQALRSSKEDMLIRVRSVANIVAGETAICRVEAFPNKLIFKDNELVYRKIIDLNSLKTNEDDEFMEFLADVNKIAVARGILPDPLTGGVGAFDAADMVETIRRIKRLTGRIVVSAYAKGPITTAGPVMIKVNVERLVNAQEIYSN